MIGYGMLYAAAVGLPVLLAAMALAAVLRHHGRPERAVWLGALALAFAVPLAGLLVMAGWTEPTASGVTGLPPVIYLDPLQVGPAARSTLDAGEMALAAWLLVSVALVARWAVATLRLRRASLSWRPGRVDGIDVWHTEDLGPAVAGVLRPRVLIPSWLFSLPGRQRAFVLLHEQEHVRAHDPLLMAATRAAPILMPWNPVVWILSSRLLRAIELDCDRRVLRHRPDVAAYGDTLLTVSARPAGRLVAAAAFAESEAPLRSRILAMTTPTRALSVLGLLSALVLGLFLVVGAFQIPIPALRLQVDIGPSQATARAPQGRSEQTVRLRGAVEELERSATSLDEAVAARVRSVDLEMTAAELAAAQRTLDGVQATAADEIYAAAAAVRAEETRREAREASRGGQEDVQKMLEAYRAAQAAAATAQGATPSAEELGLFRLPIDPDAGEPRFTPFTVAPQLLNREQVREALQREYPTLLRDSGVGGSVNVWFYIDRMGDVRSTLINESSGLEALDQAALRVAQVFRFSPALNRNERVPVWVGLPITFQVR